MLVSAMVTRDTNDIVKWTPPPSYIWVKNFLTEDPCIYKCVREKRHMSIFVVLIVHLLFEWQVVEFPCHNNLFRYL